MKNKKISVIVLTALTLLSITLSGCASTNKDTAVKSENSISSNKDISLKEEFKGIFSKTFEDKYSFKLTTSEIDSATKKQSANFVSTVAIIGADKSTNSSYIITNPDGDALGTYFKDNKSYSYLTNTNGQRKLYSSETTANYDMIPMLSGSALVNSDEFKEDYITKKDNGDGYITYEVKLPDDVTAKLGSKLATASSDSKILNYTMESKVSNKIIKNLVVRYDIVSDTTTSITINLDLQQYGKDVEMPDIDISKATPISSIPTETATDSSTK